ncbi:unnamed protein product [Arctia plantaginis]|uniref:Adenylate kinase n=1 Tax=Arctia plantaginis TaxID=874455 RepID=A0A8S1BIV6_ARCPL|nr:unnamed protein product [Arctia plantaginis]
MTETDCTKRPLQMPERFIPYLDKHRIYKLFKDMIRDLIINLPRDHIKHMKIYLSHHVYINKDVDRVMLLIEPKLTFGIEALARQLIKDLGCFVITRRCVMDRYEKHDNYEPGHVSPVLMSEVTKCLALKDPVPHAGWLMFDHPCTVREARCLQQDGVLPTVTLVLMNTPPPAPPASNDHTSARNFFQQDFEGLKYAYRATLKEVHIEEEDDLEKIVSKCLNAVRACSTGAQGPKQGFHVVGAPGLYRVVLLGPSGSGRNSQARALAKHFGLVYLSFQDIFNEAREKDNEIGARIRKFGTSIQVRAEVVKERLLRKDCLENGWVLAGYPTCGNDFELLENHSTPPNRIIFLNADTETCKARKLANGVDWCTGKTVPFGGPRVLRHPQDNEEVLDYELDAYFSDALAELRAAAGLSAEEIDANEPFDKVQVKIQAAVIAAPIFDIEACSQIRNARGD